MTPGRTSTAFVHEPGTGLRACRHHKRTLTRGTLSLAAHAGANKLAFQGLIAHSKKLPLGRYTLLVTASNKAGQRSRAQALHFTIAR